MQTIKQTTKYALALSMGLLLLISVFSGTFATPCLAQQNIEFQLTADKAKALLRCPTDESKAFVDDCFTLVNLGKIPQSAVLSSFQYAMRQAKENQRWYYFQKSMEVWAQNLKIDLNVLRASLKQSPKGLTKSSKSASKEIKSPSERQDPLSWFLQQKPTAPKMPSLFKIKTDPGKK